ncbi:hypothetical protein PYV00_19360 [Novosphingobium sp. H3SJ31-1]|uniref:Uncharacterized protein n=1 Tax=Novosphingobium album (ex Liu et al. 2023) TaxID=3031130 RepID=A0ABT5WVC4_9SPHN|nr:hypothetical protein [Novosphingobium album (ex Liu et al. 2023)]MDE8653853.1 hypothetical protein [Novosphingobium album (ex Liu et al. 2023)]
MQTIFWRLRLDVSGMAFLLGQPALAFLLAGLRLRLKPFLALPFGIALLFLQPKRALGFPGRTIGLELLSQIAVQFRDAFVMRLALLDDAKLQLPSFGKLCIDQPLALFAIALQRFPRPALGLFALLSAASGDAVEQARKASALEFGALCVFAPLALGEALVEPAPLFGMAGLHCQALGIERFQAVVTLALGFLDQPLQFGRDLLGHIGAGVIETAKRFAFAETFADFPGLPVEQLGQGQHFAAPGHGGIRATVASGEIKAARLQRLLQRSGIVGDGPGFLRGKLDLLGIEARALGLLVKSEIEIAGIALALVDQAGWKLPSLFEIGLAGDFLQALLEEGMLNAGHRLGIDPRPDGMGVSARFLLVEDDDARLILKPVAPFDLRDDLLEGRDVDLLVGWR